MLEKIIPFALAQRGLELEYPRVFGIQPGTATTTSLPEAVSYVFGLGIWLVGFVAFGALLWGGFVWLTSAGNPVLLKEGRDRIISAFLGIIILLSSYIILNTINPRLVSLDVRPLLVAEREPAREPRPLRPEEIVLVSKELSLGSAVERGVLAPERTQRTKEIFENLEISLGKERARFNSTKIKRISDLNKYLLTLTEKCQCGNMAAFAAMPEAGGKDIACTGEPCEEETKAQMQRVLGLNKQALQELLAFRASISGEKHNLETELTRLADMEEEILACQQGPGVYSLQEYTNLAQFYDEQGSRAEVIAGPYESRADPLTFYCPVGGTAFERPFSAKIEFTTEAVGETLPEASDFDIAPLSCPVEIPLGQALDSIRELAISLSIKMEKAALLIDDMAKEISRVSDLVDQFNGKDCRMQSACVPNPCWRPVCPSGVPFDPCVPPLCRPKCLQVVGVCTGSPGPKQELSDTVDKIKEIEEELLLTIKQVRNIFPQFEFALRDPENPINLQNIRTAVQLTSSPYRASELGLEQDWVLLNCESAIGNIGPDGLIIASCQPRNFFACTPNNASLPAFPTAIKNRPYTEIPPREYTPLPASSDNCPKGWLCNADVRNYNQYRDASEPVKQLLSCMRQRLDKIEKEKEIKQKLGRITSISDSKLTIGTCDWTKGPLSPGGCSHTYSVRFGREIVSAHYGGPLCRYKKQSFAVDIGARESYEKRYAEEIIEAAKECAPGAWIGYQIPGHYEHIHISIGRAYQCGAN